MSEQIPTNPTPTAVPWSPDMMTPEPAALPAPAFAQDFAPAQPPAQPAPQHQAPQHPAAHYQAAQPAYVPPVEAQTYAPQAHMAQAQMQPQLQPSQYAPAPQSQHVQPPQHAPVLQQAHHMQQSAPPQMAQAAVASQMAWQAQMPSQGQLNGQPQYAQPGPPPPMTLRQQIPPADLGMPDMGSQAPEKPKSFIANLLKRSPKPAQAAAALEAPVASGSLFNKNFVLGAVTGLVLGAFVLPMVLGKFVGDSAPEQALAQAAPLTNFEPVPAATDGDTFIDNAIAIDAP